MYLLRVAIDIWPEGPEIVTAYKTSQIVKLVSIEILDASRRVSEATRVDFELIKD